MQTDNAAPEVCLNYLLECARSWDPEARLLGNLRAADIIRSVEALITERGYARELHKKAVDARFEAVSERNKLLTVLGDLVTANHYLLSDYRVTDHHPVHKHMARARELLTEGGVSVRGHREEVERLRDKVAALTAERDEAHALLEVPLRKMVFFCQDYPRDKESAAWLERARVLCSPRPERSDG